MTKTYILEGLCCPNCAAKIDVEAKKIQGVTNAKVDHANTSIALVFSGSEDAIKQAIAGICAEVDEDIIVKESSLWTL